MNMDQVRGRVDVVRGWVTELAGRIAGTETLSQIGAQDRALGKARAAYGDARQAVRKREAAAERTQAQGAP